MRMLTTLLAIAAFALVGCGDDDTNNGDSNSANGSANTNPNGSTGNSANGSTNAATNAANSPTCNPDFSEADACGGDPVGTWAVGGACVEPIEVPGCRAAEVTVTTRDVAGTLVVTESNWAYNVSGNVVYEASIPASCVALVGGCDGVATAFEAECTDPGDGTCDCTLEESVAIASTGGYTLEDGNRAVLDDGDEWIFCIEGDGITLRDSNAAESATYVGGR